MKQNRTKIIGITGGIGSGKSRVLTYLEARWNAHVIQADSVGHAQMKKGTECYGQIVSQFGRAIIGADGELDRGKLGNIVFPEPGQLERLNKIVHPAVKAAISEEVRAWTGRCRYIVIEAALLIEDHYEELCDELWYVYAKEQLRADRLRESRGYDDRKIEQIMKQQQPEAVFRKHCSFVLDNSGSWQDTERQIDEKMNREENPPENKEDLSWQ